MISGNNKNNSILLDKELKILRNAVEVAEKKNMIAAKTPTTKVIYDLLEHLDLESVVNNCRIHYTTASTSDKEKIIKRIRILENFIAREKIFMFLELTENILQRNY